MMFFIQGLQVHVTYTILIRSFKCACEVNLGLLYSILFHKEVKPESVLIFKSGFLNLIFKSQLGSKANSIELFQWKRKSRYDEEFA